MNRQLLFILLFAMLLAFTVNSIVYFSFGNVYSTSILNYDSFSAQFSAGIYSFRVLSAVLVVWIYNLLGSLNPDYNILKLKFLDGNADPQLYVAFYLLNTFFLILSAAVFTLITSLKNFAATSTEKLLLISVAVISIAVTQYVILPYDCSSYFFLLLFIFVFLQYIESGRNSLLMISSTLIFISALNRETAALSLSFAGAALYYRDGFTRKNFLILSLLSGIFLATYLGLRISAHHFTTNDGNLLQENLFQLKNLFGILFWLVFFTFSLLLANGQNSRRIIAFFHFLAVPYIVMCFYTGILYEVRLYIPLFLTSLILGRYTLVRGTNS